MPNRAILCVDDEPIVLQSLRSQLKKNFGNLFEYECAESVEDAWQLMGILKDSGVEVLVIVSDWLMPTTKGDEFLVQLHQKFPEMVKIMLTGQANEDAVTHAKSDAGLYACIRKPWSENELVETIKMGLKRHE